MMTAHNNFDRIARVYDRLSNLIFGKSMRDAQTFFLREIAPDAAVLIMGGGTGWLLARILNNNMTCRIWYVEASSNMISLSKEKTPRDAMNRVTFIHGSEDSIPAHITFDVVITPFYLDLFMPAHCSNVIKQINAVLHSKSIWLVTEFTNTAWWHSVMLFVMYRFFEMTTRIEASRLPDWESILKSNGLREIRSHMFYRRFIKSVVFNFQPETISSNLLLKHQRVLA